MRKKQKVIISSFFVFFIGVAPLPASSQEGKEGFVDDLPKGKEAGSQGAWQGMKDKKRSEKKWLPLRLF